MSWLNTRDADALRADLATAIAAERRAVEQLNEARRLLGEAERERDEARAGLKALHDKRNAERSDKARDRLLVPWRAAVDGLRQGRDAAIARAETAEKALASFETAMQVELETRKACRFRSPKMNDCCTGYVWNEERRREAERERDEALARCVAQENICDTEHLCLVEHRAILATIQKETPPLPKKGGVEHCGDTEKRCYYFIGDGCLCECCV